MLQYNNYIAHCYTVILLPAVDIDVSLSMVLQPNVGNVKTNIF